MPFSCIYLDKIRMWLSDWILNHRLRRLRVCRHVRMTWGAIAGVTPVTTGPRVRWIATSIAVGWVAIPGPVVSVTAVRWIAMWRICWNQSKEAWVDPLLYEWMYMKKKCTSLYAAIPIRNFLQKRRTYIVLSRWQYKWTPCGRVQLSPAEWQNTRYVEEQENTFPRLCLTRCNVGKSRALRTYLWRSGGSNYHFHFRRLVSVMTIFCHSATFLNLHSFNHFGENCSNITYSFQQTLC